MNSLEQDIRDALERRREMLEKGSETDDVGLELWCRMLQALEKDIVFMTDQYFNGPRRRRNP